MEQVLHSEHHQFFHVLCLPTYPFLRTPSTALRIPLLLDLEVVDLSDSEGVQRFSVDFFSVSSDQKHRWWWKERRGGKSTFTVSAWARLGQQRARLTGRTAHDGLFDDVGARHSLLKALGPLLQKPLARHHLQLPANTHFYWSKHSVCLKLNIFNPFEGLYISPVTGVAALGS